MICIMPFHQATNLGEFSPDVFAVGLALASNNVCHGFGFLDLLTQLSFVRTRCSDVFQIFHVGGSAWGACGQVMHWR